MAHATGSLRALIYAQEWKFGSGRGKLSEGYTALRNTADSLNMTKTTTQSAELSGDRAIRYLRHGNEAVGGDISFEFAPYAYDELLAAAVGGTWGTDFATVELTLETKPEANDTITIGSDTFTFKAVKDNKYTVELGATVADSQTNLLETVNALSDVVFMGAWANDTSVVSAKFAGLWANGIPTESDLTDNTDGFDAVALSGGDDGDELIQGLALFSYAIEKGFTDIEQYAVYKGCVVDSLTLDISTDAIVTGSVTFVGASLDPLTDESVETVDPIVLKQVEPFSATEVDILLDGRNDCVVTSLNLTIENGITANYALCGSKAVSVAPDRVNITGTVTALFEDETELNRFVHEETFDINITFSAGGNSYEFYLPKVKYTGGEVPVSDGGVISLSLPFQALYDEIAESAIVISRTLV